MRIVAIAAGASKAGSSRPCLIGHMEPMEIRRSVSERRFISREDVTIQHALIVAAKTERVSVGVLGISRRVLSVILDRIPSREQPIFGTRMWFVAVPAGSVRTMGRRQRDLSLNIRNRPSRHFHLLVVARQTKFGGGLP